MNTVTDVAAHIKQIWSSSAFMNLLKIEIDEIHCGGATVKMPIDFDIHTNHWLGVHGAATLYANREQNPLENVTIDGDSPVCEAKCSIAVS